MTQCKNRNVDPCACVTYLSYIYIFFFFQVNNEIVATPILETDYTIIRHGKYTVLTNLCGTKVLFDGKRTVKIVTGRTAAANASGICGNCDGDSTNDNILSDGTDVTSDPHKDILIGNSWWTPKPGETEAT